MFTRSAVLTIIFLMCLSGFSAAVERFDVVQPQDTAFLPYRSVIFKDVQQNPDARKTNKLFYAYQPRLSDSEKFYYLGLNLPHAWEDQTFNIDVLSYPPAQLELQAAVRMTPTRWNYHRDPTTGYEAVIVVGFHNDSAWVVEYDPKTAEYERLFLQAGEDGTGTGRWEPDVNIALLEDYDYDGRVEALVHVAPVRDKGVRTMYCVELGSLEIEWSLPIALGFSNPNRMHRLGDTANPGVIFLTRGSWQGKVDKNYNELFGYLSIIDSSGRLQYNKIIQYEPVSGMIEPFPDHKTFVIAHEYQPIDITKTDSLIEAVYDGRTTSGELHLSIIDGSGRFLQSRDIDSETRDIWMMPHKSSDSLRVWVYHADQRIRVYDSALKVLAVSKPLRERPGRYYGSWAIPGYTQTHVFSNGIYSTDLEQLVRFDNQSEAEPLTYDSLGRVTEYLTSNGHGGQFLRIERRDWIELASILYFRHRLYIVIVLTALVVGLVVVNFYRMRTRRNLVLISEQKSQLEEAQEALRAAQAQLVAQEKFRQARDIAGGFAHEIRNALAPVRVSLAKLAEVDAESLNQDQLDTMRRKIGRAVSRAVALTQRISEYSHLEKPVQVEEVDLLQVLERAVEVHRERIDETGIKVFIDAGCHVSVVGNAAHFEIVFSNLISNAIDALEGVETPVIRIDGRPTDTQVNIHRVMVMDNGTGLGQSDPGRVFDFFYTTKPTTGTGVGLAIVKKIVEMYGGSAGVEIHRDWTIFGVALERGSVDPERHSNSD